MSGAIVILTAGLIIIPELSVRLQTRVHIRIHITTVEEAALRAVEISREEVTLLRVIQHRPANPDQTHTGVLKAIPYLQDEVWKNRLTHHHHHTEAPHQEAADHIAVEENPEDLIHPDPHRAHQAHHREVEAARLHQAVEVDRADVR